MTITPANGTIYVTQSNREFKKIYRDSFPDTKEGQRSAFIWANAIALGWDNSQDEDWEKHHAA